MNNLALLESTWSYLRIVNDHILEGVQMFDIHLAIGLNNRYLMGMMESVQHNLYATICQE